MTAWLRLAWGRVPGWAHVPLAVVGVLVVVVIAHESADAALAMMGALSAVGVAALAKARASRARGAAVEAHEASDVARRAIVAADRMARAKAARRQAQARMMGDALDDAEAKAKAAALARLHRESEQ